jgi:hypothetical protein
VELIEATGGGVLVEPGSQAALCGALRGLVLAPDEARRLGRQGRRAVLGRFTADRAARDVAAVLGSVGAGPALPAGRNGV